MMSKSQLSKLHVILTCSLYAALAVANVNNTEPNYVQNGSTLRSVTCDNTGQQCNAVGSFFQAITLKLFPLSVASYDRFNTWVINTSFSLPGAINSSRLRGAALSNSSCDSTGLHCVAVGQYDSIANNAQVPLVYTSLNGGRSWSLGANFYLPLDAATNMDARLTSVRCDNAGVKCTTVGIYTNKANHEIPLSYTTIDGGYTWKRGGIFLLPQDITLTPLLDDEMNITSVTCDITGFQCTIVGSYINTQRLVLPLSYTSLDGGNTWLLSDPLPLLTKYNARDTVLTGIACDATGLQCAAVGSYTNYNNSQKTPISYISPNGGQSWTLSTPLPVPNYALWVNEIFGIACDNKGLKCVAVGQHKFSDTRSEPLSYTSSDGGRNWTLSQKFNLPKGSDASVFRARLYSVACDATGVKCTSVGQYMTKEKYGALSYTSNDGGKTWTLNAELPDA